MSENIYETPYTTALKKYTEDPSWENAYATEEEIKKMIMFAITFIEQARIKIIQSQMNPSLVDGKHPDAGLPIPGVDFMTRQQYEEMKKKENEEKVLAMGLELDYNEEKVHPEPEVTTNG